MTIKNIIIMCMALLTAMMIIGCSGFKKDFPAKNLFTIGTDFMKSNPCPCKRGNFYNGHEAETGTGAGLIIRQFDISPEFDSDYFIYRISQVQYIYDYYNNFMVSPARMITEDIGKILYASSCFRPVKPDEIENISYRLWGKIIDLYGDMQDKSRPTAVMTIRMTLEKKTTIGFEPVINETYRADITADNLDARDIVDAWERCLARIISNFCQDFVNGMGQGIHGKRLGYNSINTPGAGVFRISNIGKSR